MVRIALMVIASFAFVQGIFVSRDGSILDLPYQAAILRRNLNTAEFLHHCNGVIISIGFILTTASCVGNMAYYDVNVRVGSAYHNSGGLVYSLQDINKHPSFTPNLDCDIALLKLSESLVFSYRVAKVGLPEQDFIPRSEFGVFSAWGYSDSRGHSTIHLQTTVFNIIPTNQCISIYNSFLPGKQLVTGNMICGKTFPSYPCEHDQGGPLVIGNTVYGLFSWSHNCGSNSSYPAVFTKVMAFTKWIKSRLN